MKCYQLDRLRTTGLQSLKDLEHLGLNQQGSNRYARVREHAKRVLRWLNNRKRECVSCGYDKHIEICHIKSISSFDKNVTLNEINDPSNLVLLCPNCHWEFDNGLLDIDLKKFEFLEESC